MAVNNSNNGSLEVDDALAAPSIEGILEQLATLVKDARKKNEDESKPFQENERSRDYDRTILCNKRPDSFRQTP